MIDWPEMFAAMVRHVRACGWTCALVLHGQRLQPIGTRTRQCDFVHHNDNHQG